MLEILGACLAGAVMGWLVMVVIFGGFNVDPMKHNPKVKNGKV